MNLEFILAIVRHLLGALASYLVTSGILQSGQAEQFIGAILFLFTLVWSLYNKFKMSKKVDTALELPGGSSLEKLDEVLARK